MDGVKLKSIHSLACCLPPFYLQYNTHGYYTVTTAKVTKGCIERGASSLKALIHVFSSITPKNKF